jgi:hypothetical protein
MSKAPPDDDPETEPSALDAAAWSVATPPPARRSGAWVLVARLVAAGLGLGGPILFAVGLTRGHRSMDLHTDGPIRVGLLGNGLLPVHWICHEGHDHYSVPFWLAALGLSVSGVLLWWRSGRRHVRSD